MRQLPELLILISAALAMASLVLAIVLGCVCGLDAAGQLSQIIGFTLAWTCVSGRPAADQAGEMTPSAGDPGGASRPGPLSGVGAGLHDREVTR